MSSSSPDEDDEELMSQEDVFIVLRERRQRNLGVRREVTGRDAGREVVGVVYIDQKYGR